MNNEEALCACYYDNIDLQSPKFLCVGRAAAKFGLSHEEAIEIISRKEAEWEAKHG